MHRGRGTTCDRAWHEGLVREVDETGTVRVEVASGVAVVRPGPDLEIEDDEVLRRMASRTGSPDPIVAMDPPPTGAEDVLGVVREVATHVDPFAKLGVERTSVGAAAMGPVGRGPVGRVTVHAPSPVEDDLIESFTAWAPSAQLEDLKRKTTVEVRLEAVDVLGREPVWFCASLTIMS